MKELLKKHVILMTTILNFTTIDVILKILSIFWDAVLPYKILNDEKWLHLSVETSDFDFNMLIHYL
jgi:hypothetical protein